MIEGAKSANENILKEWSEEKKIQKMKTENEELNQRKSRMENAMNKQSTRADEAG